MTRSSTVPPPRAAEIAGLQSETAERLGLYITRRTEGQPQTEIILDLMEGLRRNSRQGELSLVADAPLEMTTTEGE